MRPVLLHEGERYAGQYQSSPASTRRFSYKADHDPEILLKATLQP